MTRGHLSCIWVDKIDINLTGGSVNINYFYYLYNHTFDMCMKVH